MPNDKVSLDELTKIVDSDPLWAARGRAIGAYANLEHIMCSMFAHLGEMPSEVAGVIYFKITSAQVIKSILDKLMRRRYGDTYNLFWNSFLKEFGKLANSRNEIVHWLPENTHQVTEEGRTFEMKLFPPHRHFGNDPDDTPVLTAADLASFRAKCSFLGTQCWSLLWWITSDDDGTPLPERYLQPIAYPPLSSLLRYPKHEEPQTPPQASPQ
jgi:hypothetical protein